MREMTAANLRSAFGGESMAHLRYKVWAAKAESDGFPNVARLFRAIARAEEAHAAGHFKVMCQVGGGFPVTAGGGFGLAGTGENLAGAIEGENFEVREMYPCFLEVARAQSEKGAVQSMSWAVAAEAIHADMYAQAKAAVDAGRDMELGTVQICTRCGHTFEADEAPDKCPVCSAKKSFYVSFE